MKLCAEKLLVACRTGDWATAKAVVPVLDSKCGPPESGQKHPEMPESSSTPRRSSLPIHISLQSSTFFNEYPPLLQLFMFSASPYTLQATNGHDGPPGLACSEGTCAHVYIRPQTLL